jgi:hypothetical protein
MLRRTRKSQILDSISISLSISRYFSSLHTKHRCNLVCRTHISTSCTHLTFHPAWNYVLRIQEYVNCYFLKYGSKQNSIIVGFSFQFSLWCTATFSSSSLRVRQGSARCYRGRRWKTTSFLRFWRSCACRWAASRCPG